MCMWCIPYNQKFSPGENFHQFHHLVLLAKICSAICLSCLNDYIEYNIMVTFTALTKIYSIEYFCNTTVPGLGKIFVQRKFSVIIGASLSEPHIDEKHMRELFIYIYIYMYVWYDRHPRRRSYTIHGVHSKIFRAIRTACCNVCVLHCARKRATYIATCSSPTYALYF